MKKGRRNTPTKFGVDEHFLQGLAYEPKKKAQLKQKESIRISPKNQREKLKGKKITFGLGQRVKVEVEPTKCGL